MYSLSFQSNKNNFFLKQNHFSYFKVKLNLMKYGGITANWISLKFLLMYFFY